MFRLHSRSQVAVATAAAWICCFVPFFFSNHCGSASAQEFVYPGQAKSERDLSTCEPYEICSVVHKRYWFANKVERLCRCDRQECSSSWSDLANDDNYTMTLNNRAQIKFCESVTALPSCLMANANTATVSAVNATTATATATATSTTPAQQRFLIIVNETRVEIINNVTVKNYKLSSKAQCYCSSRHIWIAHAFHKNQSTTGGGSVTSTWTSYRCSELKKCKAGDMCGFERTDFYSNYYTCSCPYDHICVRQNHSIIHQVNQVLYDGPAFVTNCQKRQTKQEIYADAKRPIGT